MVCGSWVVVCGSGVVGYVSWVAVAVILLFLSILSLSPSLDCWIKIVMGVILLSSSTIVRVNKYSKLNAVKESWEIPTFALLPTFQLYLDISNLPKHLRDSPFDNRRGAPLI